jgi:hypothetical protein
MITLWLLLVLSLPSQSATPRMRVWRALKALGAGVLRDGVYLLPESEAGRQALQGLADEVTQAGGVVYLLEVSDPEGHQTELFRPLFDRTQDYARLLQAAQELRGRLSDHGAAEARRALRQLHRELDAVRAIDLFPGPARAQAEQALTEAEAALAMLLSPGEPHAAAGEVRRLHRRDYRGRVWATRARPWVDRLASAWLILRFIDPEAHFLWLKDPKDCPHEALGFDFNGATFTHVGARVTFEMLLASFGLEQDRALARMGVLVHYLDVGGVPVPEAAGLQAILSGARGSCRDDDALLAAVLGAFDFLYAAYSADEG